MFSLTNCMTVGLIVINGENLLKSQIMVVVEVYDFFTLVVFV